MPTTASQNVHADAAAIAASKAFASETTASELAVSETAVSETTVSEKPTAALTRRVLIAEDGLFNQLLLSTILRQHGLAVEVVGDGAMAVTRAIEALQTGSAFDLILMDIQMPTMDGDAATARLRGMGYVGAIVAVSADDTDVERARCINAGYDAYLSKPIDRATLLAVVNTYLSGGTNPVATAATDSALPKSATAFAPLFSAYADDPDIGMLIAGFVDQLPDTVTAMRSAVVSGDLAGITRLSHQLSGAAGSYGFMPVSHAAAALERAARGAVSTDSLMPELEGLAQICALVRK